MVCFVLAQQEAAGWGAKSRENPVGDCFFTCRDTKAKYFDTYKRGNTNAPVD